jgi:hypothetical protein
MELTPIRVEIGLNGDGTHKYPPFNEIAAELRDNMDWSRFIDAYGGWQYDKCCGHCDDGCDENDPVCNSPNGCWLGILLVPSDFAEAATGLPGVTELSYEDAKRFYETRVTKHQSATLVDIEAMNAIKARRDAGVPDDDDVTSALDINDDTPGMRLNPVKTFDGLCAKMGHKCKGKPA